MLQKAVPTQNVTNPVALHSFYCVSDISVLSDSKQCFFISHTIGATDLLHPTQGILNTAALLILRTFKLKPRTHCTQYETLLDGTKGSD